MENGWRVEGYATIGSALTTSASILCVRFTRNTGIPRQATVIISPGPSVLMSAVTGAPAALTLSEGANDFFDKRHKCSYTGDATRDRRCNQPFTTTTVHAINLIGFQLALQSFKAHSAH